MEKNSVTIFQPENEIPTNKIIIILIYPFKAEAIDLDLSLSNYLSCLILVENEQNFHKKSFSIQHHIPQAEKIIFGVLLWYKRATKVVIGYHIPGVQPYGVQ